MGDTIEESNYVGYSLTLENKSDLYLLVDIDNGSVDGFMTYIDVQGGSVAPGKKSKAEMRFYESNTDVKSLDDLKNVEGEFKILTNNDGSNTYSSNKDRYPFVINGAEDTSSAEETAENTNESSKETEEQPASEGAETQASSNVNPIVLGETISSDDWDFTIDNVELSYEIMPRNTSSVYTSYPAEDGKVYVHIDGQYYNKSKKNVCIRDLPVPSADYNDGYTYDGFVIVDDGDDRFDWVSSQVVCEPLTTCHYHGLVECPKVIDETEDPLFITIKMSNKKVYRYDIR